MNWIGLDYNYITMNYTVIGLNWASLRCPEMTFVVIWRYINKTELNLTEFGELEHSPIRQMFIYTVPPCNTIGASYEINA